MSAVITPAYGTRPVVALNEKLPAPPPPLQDDVPPSLLPPKDVDHIPASPLPGRPELPPIPAMSSIGCQHCPLCLLFLTAISAFDMSSPSSPMTSSPYPAESAPSPVDKPKKTTPLLDLIESEKLYVELLTGIIRKVAAAWSRSDLPPPELDAMFRSVESVYKVNRTLLGKLKEIGENPSSPKALGDLLMRWIDDLDWPYTTYSEKYCSGFDDWEPVKSNPKLAGVLEAFSLASPPPVTTVQISHPPDPSIWTLDALFLLPKSRLQYYRKLYGRLLKSTTPGRSDYRLLTVALEKLDILLATLDSRSHIKVGRTHPSPAPRSEFNKEPVTSTEELVPGNALLSGQFGARPTSAANSSHGSSSSRGERLSSETSLAPTKLDSSPPITSIADLESRLATDTTLDIFTMQPKQVRLQLMPPSLPYTRELHASAAVVIRFTPKSTGVEVVHRYGHLFILSDLFLVCERISPEEGLTGGQDMRLCYPPLSGKVLKVVEVPEQANTLSISIMRKETLTLQADSELRRNELIKQFRECIAFARAISGAAQEPIPPLPPKGSLPSSPVVPSTNPPVQQQLHSNEMGSRTGAQGTRDKLGGISGHAPDHVRVNSPPQETFAHRRGSVPPSQLHGSRASAESGLSSGPVSPEFQAASAMQRVPSLQNPLPGPVYPTHKSSTPSGTANPPPSSFAPGQIVPPPRGASIQGPRSDPSAATAGPPGRVHSPPSQNFPVQPLPSAPVHTLRHQTSVHSMHHSPNHPHNSPPTGLPVQHPPRPPLGQPYLSRPPGSPHGMLPSRPPSEPPSSQRLQKSPSSRSLGAQYEYGQATPPPVPSFAGVPVPAVQRPYPAVATNPVPTRPLLPSQVGSRTNSFSEPSFQDPSPPTSPVEESKPPQPVRSTISAQMKCKVFHQQQHAQWKSLGSARLTLYKQEPTNVKQLVVEADSKDKGILISTIVLTDGVERVGKTGVAIELSDAKGGRTGVIYMIQLRNESSASGLFETLLAGSDRSSK
ncbi:hypothetical protein ID866_1763 [Astraeus odoratus]|nr:hypothetical protein ID866_1763 [Astraeus odoratus]